MGEGCSLREQVRRTKRLYKLVEDGEGGSGATSTGGVGEGRGGGIEGRKKGKGRGRICLLNARRGISSKSSQKKGETALYIYIYIRQFVLLSHPPHRPLAEIKSNIILPSLVSEGVPSSGFC